MMKNIVNFIKHAIFIIEGYSVWIWNIVTGKTRQKAIKRLEYCNICEHNENGICKLCGCIIKAKVRVDYPEDENGKSIEGCPEKKW